MTPVDVRGLHKHYGTGTAVAGVDFEIQAGEVFALLGPNGAGKTTTMEILTGHRHRTGGDVSVLGVDPGRADRAWRTQIGVVLQATTDAAELTVSETVHHYAKYYPTPRDPDAVIDLVGLSPKSTARVHTLSGGQRRRLDVALGIVGTPRLLFLDEPTTGFAPEARHQFWKLVRTLAADGTTILLTTHYLDEVEALADRVAVIVEGRIVAEGTPAALGGREPGQAVVRWIDAAGRQERKTTRPAQLIAELSAGGAELRDLTVTRPSLEDRYLDLIGQLR